MGAEAKPLAWLHGEVRTPPFSREARIEAGLLLRRLQEGESTGMPHSRLMPAIGGRCHELRIQDEDHTWRVVYRIDNDAIALLEVFDKKTQATPTSVIEACRQPMWNYDSIDRTSRRGQDMKKAKRESLERKGWRVGSASEFLGLDQAEIALVEIKLALSRNLRERRTKRGLTQTDLARQLQSSQSRIAKMEAADASVSVDLLVRSLFALGATPKDLGRVLTRSHASHD